MIAEHEIGILTEALPKYGLRAGESVVVVDVQGGGGGYLVEIFTPAGETRDVVYVESDQIRPRTAAETPEPRARPPLIATGSRVFLSKSMPEYDLQRGEEAVVLCSHQGGLAYALEIRRADGRTIKAPCVFAEDLSPIQESKVVFVGGT